MKIKRMLLIVFLITFTIVCFYSMNSTFDRLARYQYVTEENREMIETHMSDDDIAYMVQQKIKPEQFERFISLQGFTVKNTLYYDLFDQLAPTDDQYIVSFVNAYRNQFSYGEIKNLLTNYSYDQLESFYQGNYVYLNNAKLISNPQQLKLNIEAAETMYTYVPKDLVTIDQDILPNIAKSDGSALQLKSEVIAPLSDMCREIQKTNNKVCGALIMNEGYISYEEQIRLHDDALIQYGAEKMLDYVFMPGQDERQTGYILSMTVSEMDAYDKIMKSSQLQWLKEHAKEYGFEIHNIDKDEKNLKTAITLRYIGVDKEVRK